jgi:formylglycine-generating enzyme required for sulfatase activity
MTASPASLLTLSVQLPARWAVGTARSVKVTLGNVCAADLKNVRLRTGWRGLEPPESRWCVVGTLRRGAILDETVPVTAPMPGENQFQMELRADLGPYLQLELWSGKLDVTARTPPGAEGAVKVVFENSGISGDKLGQGQLAAEGAASIGHQVHLHGSRATADFERWLAEDEHARQMRALPLYIAHETCLPWTTPSGLELLGIPRGEFLMGASVDDHEALPEEKIRREVSLTRSYWMSRHLITNAQYSAVTQAPTPVTLKGHQGDRMPVANLTWGQAVDFCTRLTERERAAGVLPPGYAYRLPTEAEWEHACRAGCAAPRHGPLEKIGSTQASGGRMLEVGRFEPNAWGLQDMLGLVFEWCLDAYEPYKLLELTDPVCWEPPASQELKRVVRGGCYQGPDTYARASARLGREPGRASHRIGFRVVLVRE